MLIAVLILVAAVLSTTAVEATEPPESCRFDPAFGAAGFAVTEVVDDDFEVTRMTLDESGRLYTINTLTADDGSSSDVVRRFLADGQLDASFGTDGSVELPDQTSSSTGRALTVDEQGRLWVVRNSSVSLREIRRLTPSGELDVSVPLIGLEATFSDDLRFGPVGAISADGSDVVLGHTILAPGFIGLSHVRITSEGEVTRNDFRRVEGSGTADISSIDPSGWMGGVLEVDGTSRPLLWDGNSASQAYWPRERQGAFTAVTELDGVVTAVGVESSESGQGEPGQGEMFSLDFGPDRPQFLDASEPDGAELIRSGVNAIPLALLPERGIASLTVGSSGLDLAVGTFGPQRRVTNSVLGATPAEVVSLASATQDSSGSLMVAGVSDLEQGQAFILRVTPDLGPAVSVDALDDQIERLYEAYYLRGPDAGGLAFWREQRASGAPLETISAQFAASPEFGDLYGDLSDAAFVDLIYTNVLGRPGDDVGRAFWTSQLEAGERTRGSVMVEFSDSEENIDRTSTSAPHDDETGEVYRLYKAYFDRAPDAGGSCFWVRRLVGGASLDQVSDSFASSQEFAETYGSLSNREFVELVYANVLGRPGEVAGVDFWTGELDDEQRTRGQVMLGFSESPEYIERTGTLPVD